MIEEFVREQASSHGASDALAARLAERAAALSRLSGEPTSPDRSGSTVVVYVPGRIEVLGKHADYVGGSSIVCAAERGMLMLARPRPDTLVRMTDVDRGTNMAFDLAVLPNHPVGSWGLYLLTVLRRLTRNFPEAIGGLEVTFCSDLPSAAGLSSSSALVTGCLLAWTTALGLPKTDRYRSALPTAVDLATYLGCVENGHDFPNLPGERGVGTRGGCQDHVAIVCSEPDALTRWTYLPTHRAGTWALPTSLTFAVISSGVAARKAGAAREDFNRLAALGAELTRLGQVVTGRPGISIASALTSEADGVDAVRELIASGAGRNFAPADLMRRLDHVVRESLVLVPAAWAAFERHDWTTFGELVATSQESADALLGNQVTETRALVRLACEGGALAASAFGAGFGGSVWALVPTSDADAFLARWLDAYRQAFPERRERSTAFVTRPGPPALVMTPYSTVQDG